MAMKLSTCFLCQSIVNFSCSYGNYSNLQLPFAYLHYPVHHYPLLLPASCKMHPRSFSSQQKRQVIKKNEQQNPTNGDEEYSESESTLLPEIATSLDINRDGVQKLSSVQLADLLGMITNVEKNFILINEARLRALEDLEKTLNEKKTLQEEMNVLKMKLAEADAVAAQEKMHAELLEDQLEKLQNELNKRGGSEGSEIDVSGYQNEILNEHANSPHTIGKYLDSLRAENLSLKTDILALKGELNNVKLMDEHVIHHGKECSLSESSLKELESKIDDMPREFWSHILLKIDGWLLEKKISTEDAKVLREMVWKMDRHIYDQYVACRGKSEEDVLSMFLRLTSAQKSPGLHVIHIAAEMAPVAKVGGLGDVVTGLGKALQKRGHLVEIVLPKYDCMQCNHIHDLRELDVPVESSFDGKLYQNKIWVGTVEGLPVYFVEPHHPHKLFWRGQFYGEHDDFKRFSYFSRAALELLLRTGKKPDIIHCHDWQTAFVAPLYWNIYAIKGLKSASICFTCHNFEYQGTAPASEIASCGLDVYSVNRPDRMQDHSSRDRVNPVKGAIVYSNIVTTVSPNYAQEVRTAEGGRGLHTTLNLHSKKFIGILNGIDTDVWNPSTDTYLEVQYSADDIQGKAETKAAMRSNLGLSSADVRQPLVGCITRLVPQKGVHLIRHAIYRTLDLGGQFILLGSSPVQHIQREFEDIAKQFQNHDHARLILKYDEALSHSIYAASDVFIIPSLFEPCGLTQMIAMKYGSIPIARKTGGLSDSVFDIDDDTIPLEFRNGFTFFSPTEQEMNRSLDRAFNLYRNNPDTWQKLVERVMNIDFGWETSASRYEDLYAKATAAASHA